MFSHLYYFINFKHSNIIIARSIPYLNSVAIITINEFVIVIVIVEITVISVEFA